MRHVGPSLRPAAFVGAAILAFALGTTPAAAQSLFATHGLGLVTAPEDALSTGIGGVSLGLPGSEISWLNPAGAAGIPAPGLVVSMKLDQFQARYTAEKSSGTTARFPMVLAAFPLGARWAFTAGYGTFLDQRWAVERRDTLSLGIDTIPILDRVVSDGGVSRARVGAGYRLTPTLALGLGLDVYTGGVERTASRLFVKPEETIGNTQTVTGWTYSGTGMLASLDWNPNPALSLAASVSPGATLRAGGRNSESADKRFKLPATVTVGTSARIAINTVVALSADWAGWSRANAGLEGAGGARDVWGLHGGVVWDATRWGSHIIPLRFGGRYQTLPFRSATATDWAAERALSGGTSISVGGGAARFDISVERGWRDGGGQDLEDSYWSVGASLTVLGR